MDFEIERMLQMHMPISISFGIFCTGLTCVLVRILM